MSVQDVKDTFYAAVRDRVAANNAGRTIVLRGVTRPAVVVIENELPSVATAVADAFALHWTSASVDPLGMAKLICEIRYATAGTTGVAGMDRGRALAAMDAELRSALRAGPQNVALVSSSEVNGGGATTQTALGTSIFWSDGVFGVSAERGERLERTVTVEVFGYE